MVSAEVASYWYALPNTVKTQFRNIANKGEWTAQEAFDHLVPDGLKDNPQEVVTFMDGGTVTQEVWVYDQGTASGHYEEVTYELPDRDVSRIQSGANGGEYSAENTVMEDMSVNRARGSADMTEVEDQATVEANAVDEQVIEAAFDSATESTLEAADVLAESVAAGFLESLGDFIGFTAPPIILAMKGGRAFSDDTDEQAGCALTIGTIATIGMFTPAAPLIGLSALGCTVHSLGNTVYRWVTAPAK